MIKLNSILSTLIIWGYLSQMMSCKTKPAISTIDLSGVWQFQIDSTNIGEKEAWYSKDLNDTILLPASMAQRNKGNLPDLNTKWVGEIMDSSFFTSDKYKKYRSPDNFKMPFWLQPNRVYNGKAWYKKSIELPQNWSGQQAMMSLERCHIVSKVWVNGKFIGTSNSLGTSHDFLIPVSVLKSGRNDIAICVDNSKEVIIVGNNSHSVTDHTQTNWNGIVGKMELKVLPSIQIKNVKVVPVLAENMADVYFEIESSDAQANTATAQLTLAANPINFQQSAKIESLKNTLEIKKGVQTYHFRLPMGNDYKTWSELEPNVYKLDIKIEGEGVSQVATSNFGMRQFASEGTHFTINGKKTFLRGTLDCAIFPLTGYVPTDTASWMNICRVVKSYGLNHIRFHSYCPPEAAFIAADFMGVYLEVEVSSWAMFGASVGDGKPIDKFIYEESERMVKNYANHPSFCLLMYGNEPSGDNKDKYLNDFVIYWKNKDHRFLVSTGAGWPVTPDVQFASTPEPRIYGWYGWSKVELNNPAGVSGNFDWLSTIQKYQVPTLSHEIGQFCVYPDFKEMKFYTGVLKPKNFETFLENLQEQNLGHLADSLLLASGKLQALCYKAEIEAALRTKGMGGFQLLGLQDFPGQGTALVGVVNAFWKDKGYITPAQFKAFCNSTVPLARFPKFTFYNHETLNIPVEVAHFGLQDLKRVVPTWQLLDAENKVVESGELAEQDISIGNGIALGKVECSLKKIVKASQLQLKIKLASFENSWNIWVYPSMKNTEAGNIIYTNKLTAQVQKQLEAGSTVVYSIPKADLSEQYGGEIVSSFTPIFWNTAWFKGAPPHTMGVLCNPKHPLFNLFPTQYHSDYQWQELMYNCATIDLSAFDADIKPVVRVVDDWFSNRSLALVMEAKVGKGKILITGIDLTSNIAKRANVAQFKQSIFEYAQSNAFNPSKVLNMEKLKLLSTK
jgi:hypothetical protein